MHKQRNVLLREGIVPANSSSVQGSKFGQPKSHTHRARDQDKSQLQSSLSERKHKKSVEYDDYDNSFLPRSNWIPLGDGWFQTTQTGSGLSTRCGLHSVIESFSGVTFMCVYEPRTHEGYSACASANPMYNLEVCSKLIRSSLSHQGSNTDSHLGYCYHLMFAMISSADYLAVECDTANHTWILYKMSEGCQTNLGECVDNNIRPNVFYNILIQVRGKFVSVDINGVPAFTAVRVNDLENLSGLVGIIAKNARFAIKGWKLRAIESSNTILRPEMGGGVASVSAAVSPLRHQVIAVGGTEKATMASSSRPSTPNRSRQQPMSLIQAMQQRSDGTACTSAVAATSYKSSALSSSMSSSSLHVFRRLGDPVQPMGGGGPGAAPLCSGSPRSTLPTGFSDVSNSNCPPDSAQAGLTQEQRLQACASVLVQRHDKGAVETVMRDAVQSDLGVTFEHIAALDTAKRLLNEAVVLPLIMPEFFTGIREPWKGVLLFGPPGTGKTLLAKAVCSFNCSTFFSCSSSSLISKYRGDSEKIVRCLFDAARLCAPSIVFLDEVDALMGCRGAEGEHEASRRMKTELFAQIDGISSHNSRKSGSADDDLSHRVMVLTTTNCPWDLDEAIRRRLEKRIYIPLPDHDARTDLFRICMTNIPMAEDVQPEDLADITEGYSGADVHVACREAAMMPLRRVMSAYSPQEIQDMRRNGEFEVPLVLRRDFLQAIDNTKASVAGANIGRYVAWQKEFGST